MDVAELREWCAERGACSDAKTWLEARAAQAAAWAANAAANAGAAAVGADAAIVRAHIAWADVEAAMGDE